MRGSVLSSRYAVALADVAEKQGCIDQVRHELQAMAGALETDRIFSIVVNTHRHGAEGKRRLFGQVAEKLGFSPPTRRLLDYLVAKNRTDIIPALAASFAHEADERLGISQGVLTSAHPLDEARKADIVSRLEKITGKQIRLREETDESLIAGFQVRLDGRFYDGSLRGRLNRLKEKMIHGD
jgi:F-type H+-transporting ATPase subunit delta